MMKRMGRLLTTVLALVVTIAAVVVVKIVLDDPAVEEARATIRLLTTAVQAYEARLGERPSNLELVRTPPDSPGPGFIELDSLLDPWGREYQYDAAGPRNDGRKPDIWSLGPDPNDKAQVIGNWQAGR
jgi:hypothetical protein